MNSPIQITYAGSNAGGYWILFLLGLLGALFVAYFLGKHKTEQNTKLASERLERSLKTNYQKQQENLERDYLAKKENLERDYLAKKGNLELQYQGRTKQLEAEYQAKQKENIVRENYLNERDQIFNKGFLEGREWLAAQFAENKKAEDDATANLLIVKRRPAQKAREALLTANAKRRDALSRIKFLEYQLKSYEEYFPFLEEYREVILDESVPLGSKKDNVLDILKADPVLKFVSKAEYDKLSFAERNQLAFEKYLKKGKSAWEVGRDYERYLGYLYEQDGWKVNYVGAIKGLEDFGRDLICSKDTQVRIVQAKNWRSERTIREKHIFQLFGTTILYKIDHPNCSVFANFYSGAAQFSPEAEKVAKELRIHLWIEPYKSYYPMIKCNINQSTHERIYHLPFDQQYDRVIIDKECGEFYAQTAQEAEDKGFRRAFRFRGPFA